VLAGSFVLDWRVSERTGANTIERGRAAVRIIHKYAPAFPDAGSPPILSRLAFNISLSDTGGKLHAARVNTKKRGWKRFVQTFAHRGPTIVLIRALSGLIGRLLRTVHHQLVDHHSYNSAQRRVK